jgi:hypothetical protein
MEATWWMAITRVFTGGEYSSYWLFENMRSLGFSQVESTLTGYLKT